MSSLSNQHQYLHQRCNDDFEGACRISETGVLPWGSHRYVPPIYRKQFAARRTGTLEDDYALGVWYFNS
jgi:hypothetical protein